MSLLRCIAIVTVIVLTGTVQPCWAQDLDVLHVDDFISPGELRTDAGRQAFVISQAFVGLDYDYTRRNELLDQNVGFVRLVNNFYYSRWQLNANFTRFAVDPSAIRPLANFDQPMGPVRTGNNMQAVPLYRVGIEGSIYNNGSQDSGSRVKLSWNSEKLLSGASEQEFGATYEIKLALPKELGEKLFGGVSYALRPAQGRQSFGFGYQYSLWSSEGGRTVRIGLGTGFEIIQGDWRGGATRLLVGFSTPVITKSMFVHVVSAITGLSSNRVGLNQLSDSGLETTVFLSVPVFSKLSSPRK